MEKQHPDLPETAYQPCPSDCECYTITSPSEAAFSPKSDSKEHELVDEHECLSDCECFEATSQNRPSNAKNESPRLPWLSTLLPLWVFLAMAIGIIIGKFVPSAGPNLNSTTFTGVSVPIFVGLLLTMYPILCKVEFEDLPKAMKTRAMWHQLAVSFVINWIVSPALMFGLAWAMLPDKGELREGLMIVGIARCIAMVLIWNELAFGDSFYCATLVAFNTILQIILFPPLAYFVVNYVSQNRHDPNAKSANLDYGSVTKYVAIFMAIPLAAALITRFLFKQMKNWKEHEAAFLSWISPISLIALLYTIIVLFASQGARVVDQIISVLRVSAPLVVYFLITFTGTMWYCLKVGKFEYAISVTQSFTAASNNFELAIAIAASLFGTQGGQALATTVGPLIEVPVLLALVYAARWVRARWVKKHSKGEV